MPSPEASRRTRCWYQFSLRTLLVATAAAAGLAFAYAKLIEPYHLQREAMAAITNLGGTYKTEDATGWVRYLDTNAQDVVVVDLADCDKPDEYLPHLLRLPKLRTLVIGGHAVGDEQLSALGRIVSLRGLVLDSTLVSDEGMHRLKEERQEVLVCTSDRRAVAQLEKLGARVAWDNDKSDDPLISEPPALTWLRVDVGDRYFARLPPVRVSYFTSKPSVDVDAVWLGNLKTASSIDVRRTNVNGTFLARMPVSLALDQMVFDGTKITDSSLAQLTRFPCLDCLSLSDTPISDEGLAHIGAISGLKVLDVNNTRITDAGVKHLVDLPHLAVLMVAGNRVGDAGLKALAAIPCLVTLGIHDTLVTDAGVPHLRQYKGLKNISLDGTGISDNSVSTLEQLTDLTDLSITSTKISPQGYRRLQAALPRCFIRY